MPQPTSRKAILKHQRKNVNANLIWGPPLPSNFDLLLNDGCKKLRQLGYSASLFPEGDGLTLNHSEYSPINALAEIRLAFPWLDIVDKQRTQADLYDGDETARCTILVPVEQFQLTTKINIAPYSFIPPISHNEIITSHPWHEYLSAADTEAIWRLRESLQNKDSLGITRADLLLTYPLIEVSIDIPYKELFAANEYPDGSSPLLRRCSEFADRGLDLIRLEECNYRHHERLPSIAGQLLDGFHAAYVIPPFSSPFKPQLYCHFASPFQVIPNWLGLDVDRELSVESDDLAPIVFGSAIDEVSQRVRGAIRTVGQSFYILTPEARFLSLIVALDGLCAPKRRWNGLAHHSYIAAVGADGEVARFKFWMETFNTAYSIMRNPIVHQGSSFIELGIAPSQVCDHMVSLIRSCISTVTNHQIEKIEDLHSHILSTLTTSGFQKVLADFVDELNKAKTHGNSCVIPKW